MGKKKKSSFFLTHESAINAVLILCIAILVGIYAFMHVQAKQEETLLTAPTETPIVWHPTATPFPTPTLTPIDMDLSHWKTYTLPTIGLSFQLPPQVADRVQELHENIYPHYKGARYLVLPSVPSENNAYYGAPFGFLMGTDSSDFQENPGIGRDGEFFDYQGFGIRDGMYYVTEPFNANVPIEPINKPQEIVSAYGVHILKIVGAPTMDASGSYIVRTGNHTVAAFINTDNPKYPGLPFQITLEGTFTEQVFDKILSTFRFIK